MSDTIIVTGGDRPPTYQAVQTNPAFLQAPPPSYKAIYGEFRQASDPVSMAQVLCAATVFGCGTVFCTTLMCVLSFIPIGMVVLGALNMDNCPAQKLIPIWLIVFGGISILDGVFRCCCSCAVREDERKKSVNPFSGIMNFLLMVWLVIGSYWIYSSKSRVQYTSTELASYCDPLTYKFSFIFVTFFYSFAVMCCLLVCCGCCCAMCMRPSHPYPTI